MMHFNNGKETVKFLSTIDPSVQLASRGLSWNTVSLNLAAIPVRKKPNNEGN
jgi:hypothetical protein